MQDEGTIVSGVKACCGIPQHIDYRLLKEFNDSNSSVLPGFTLKVKNRGTKQKHTHFFFDSVP
ncbi:hypothetical protein EDC96DRAFT_453381 [Choanephora cucurbitarum]|nr:hypothetical protein EDC96DRAFT_453381 [Choanephora cucurbitarum]